MADTEKEVQQLKKRILELARKSYEHNIYTYTGFLGMAEQDIFWGIQAQIKGIPYKLFGGSEDCERQMLRFGSEESLGYEEEFPIACLLAEPFTEKFADALSHRDYLGAVMNLGIERSSVGDIFIEGKTAYIFCTDTIEPFLSENLKKVKHTNIKVHRVEEERRLRAREPELSVFTVSSERADGLLAKIYHLPRSESLSLFRSGKVYINGRLSENGSRLLKVGDKVSVRGYGRFIYYGSGHETKKGKLSVSAGLYK